jgi:hypothetical protein
VTAPHDDQQPWLAGKPDPYPRPKFARKLAGYLPVTDELMADAGAVAQAVTAGLDRLLNPWRYPDPNPMPMLVLFPRLERLAGWYQRTLDRWYPTPADDDQ